ncbi:Por secretion system C-terminal sorting domain-containing protein [Balamuthia mandrillaris]
MPSSTALLCFFVFFGCVVSFSLGHYGPSHSGIIGLREDKPGYVPPPRPWQEIVKQMEEKKHKRQTTGLEFVFDPETPEDIQTAIRFSGEILSTLLQFDVTLKVLVTFQSAGDRVLAFATSPIVKANSDGLYYPLPFALNLLGENSPDEAINATVNADAIDELYTGLDGNPGPGQYDLVSIMTHELCHGLGFFSWVAGPTPSYQLDSLYVLDLDFEELSTGDKVADVAGSSTELSEWATSGDIYNTAIYLEGHHAKMYAPPTWESGSSISHLDETEYPSGDPNSMMTPAIAYREAIHHPGGFALKMFQQIGYPIRDCTEFTTCSACAENGCSWCFLNPTAGATVEELLESSDGFCGDPGAKPYYSWECSSGVSTGTCSGEPNDDSKTDSSDADGDGDSASTLAMPLSLALF